MLHSPPTNYQTEGSGARLRRPGTYRYKRGRGCNVKVWFPECTLFGGKNTLQKRFGTKDSVHCSEFGGVSEVANVLQVRDFQSVTRALSALGSVSVSRSVRSTVLH